MTMSSRVEIWSAAKVCRMTEEEFDRICDTFRDRRVWRIENGQWVKTIFGENLPLMDRSPMSEVGE